MNKRSLEAASLRKADNPFDGVAPFAELHLGVLTDVRGDFIAECKFALSAFIRVPQNEKLAGQLNNGINCGGGCDMLCGSSGHEAYPFVARVRAGGEVAALPRLAFSVISY